jgi:hypothetical protein
LEVTRVLSTGDNNTSLLFHSKDYKVFASDNDIFYTLEELKTLANDGMPKQGEMIEARYKTECGVLSNWYLFKFVCMHE